MTCKDAIAYIVQKYEIIAKSVVTGELIKKQSHGLKDVCCIEKLGVGLIVCGVNDMEYVEFFIFAYDDLQILCT